MSVPIRFNEGELWSYRGQRLRFQRHLGDNLLHFLDEARLGPFQIEGDDGQLRAPNVDWVLEALAAGELKRERDPQGPPVRRASGHQDIGPEEAAEMDSAARLRAFVVRGLDALPEIPRSDRSYRIALAKLWAAHPEEARQFRQPCPRAARRWMDERGSPGDRTLSQMVSMSGRVKRRARLCPEVRAHLRQAALWYWSSRRWSISDAYARLVTTLKAINEERQQGDALPQLELPSPEALRREVRGTEGFDTFREKYGLQAAKNRFKACGKGLSASRILQVGAMDHTFMDGVAVFDGAAMLPLGRPWLTVLMDVYSGCVVGFVLTFEPPSIYSVMECIKRANRPKLHLPISADEFPDLRSIFGRFDEIVVDNGKEFAGVAMQDALADIGTSLRLAPVASPTYKAVVERIFGTLNSLLNTKLPGGVLKPELLREFGYNPEKEAVLTLTELEELLWEALVLHHITPRRGEASPPGLLWKESARRHGIDVIGDDTQLDKMLGAVKYPCRVTRSGVELFGLTFHDEAKVSELLEDLAGLEPVRSRRKGSATARVKVKYNPACLSEIHVWNRRINRYVTLPCEDETYASGVSLWHHRQLQQWAAQKGEEFCSEADRLRVRANLVSKLEELAPTLKGKERRALARLQNAPQVQSYGEGPVALAYAPSRHDGLAPIVEHDVLAPERSDGGQKPSRPARMKKRPEPKAKRKKSVERQAHLKPETGNIMPLPGDALDFSVDLSSWKDIEL
jgi:putative transposase